MPPYLQYNTSALHYINPLMLGATNIKVKFKKKFDGLSSYLSPRAGSLDEVWMLLHQIVKPPID
jgi:hypothetical protein